MMMLLGLLGQGLKACWLLNRDVSMFTDSQTPWPVQGVAGSHLASQGSLGHVVPVLLL